MKICITGKVPIHIALSKAYDESGIELFSNNAIKRQIEDCYKHFTPAQNAVTYTSEDMARIQEEIEHSWLIYWALQELLDEESTLADRDTDLAIMAYMDGLYDSSDYSMPVTPRTKSRALRRKQTAKHNKRLVNNVITDYRGSENRFNVDYYFKAVINRRIISSPKSRSLRYAKLLKRAEKMKLLTLERVANS